MVYTIEEIQKKAIPIVQEYGVASLSLFGSYARGEATDDSDLDFIMDKGELKGLQYVSLVNRLEEEFKCHVDLVSSESPNKKFLNAIRDDEVLIYEQ